MTARASLVHNALLYESDREFVDTLVPFARESLEAGEPVLAALPPPKVGLLQRALGRDSDHVEFLDAGEWYQRPTRTIANMRGRLDALLANGASTVRVIGEVQFGGDHAAHVEWTKYEASLNEVFADVPAWIVCSYDRRQLPARVVENARRTHPCVSTGKGRTASPEYTSPHRLVRELSSAPDVSGAPRLVERQIPPCSLGEVRAEVRQVVEMAGVPVARTDDLVIALNEVASNALQHGRGDVDVTVWWSGWDVVARVLDEGAGVQDDLAGYAPPNVDRYREGGLGLWTARGLADRMDFVDGDDGFAVWLTVGR